MCQACLGCIIRKTDFKWIIKGYWYTNIIIIDKDLDIGYFCTSTKDHYLEIKFIDRNQVDNKTTWGLDGFCLFIQVLSANTNLFFPDFRIAFGSDFIVN